MSKPKIEIYVPKGELDVCSLYYGNEMRHDIAYITDGVMGLELCTQGFCNISYNEVTGEELEAKKLNGDYEFCLSNDKNREFDMDFLRSKLLPKYDNEFWATCYYDENNWYELFLTKDGDVVEYEVDEGYGLYEIKTFKGLEEHMTEMFAYFKKECPEYWK